MTDALIQELVGKDKGAIERQSRIKQAQDDFGYFCRTYLSDYFFEDAAAYQKLLYEVANTRSLKKEVAESLKHFVAEKYHTLLKTSDNLAGAMFIEPREHGKTVRWSFAYVLWCVLTDRARYVLLIGASAEAAGENLVNIKMEIEENELIAGDFGELSGAVWTNRRLELKNGTCIQSKGSGASMRGTRFRQYRPDLIVIDDVLKDDAINSHTQRDKIHKWLTRVVFNLGKNAFTIWVNTIFHDDDPISRLCREVASGDLVRWIAVRLSCLLSDGTPLWKEYWDAQSLLDKKKTIGSTAFSTEYMNEPLSDEERIFKPEWFIRYANVNIRDLRVYMGVDPSAGKHDEFAIFVLGIDANGTLYELDEWAECCSVDKAVSKLIEKYLAFKPVLIGFEEVGFQSIYKKYIMEAAGKQGVHLPIKGCSTRGIGKERILSLSPLIENGFFKWKENHDKTINQLTMYPKSAFDDLQDACYYAWEVSNNGAADAFAFRLHTGSSALKSALRRFSRRG